MPALPSYKLLLFSDHPIISFPYVANLYSYIGVGKRLNYVDIIGHPGEKKGEAPSHGLFSHVSLLLYYSMFRIVRGENCILSFVFTLLSIRVPCVLCCFLILFSFHLGEAAQFVMILKGKQVVGVCCDWERDGW